MPNRNPQSSVNSVYVGDCVDAHKLFASHLFDVVYVDPPFFTQRPWTGAIRTNEGLAGSDASVSQIRNAEFSDHWAGGMEDYLAWLKPRLSACWEQLTPQGCLLIHLDWHAVHYVKVLADGLWGSDRFQNELIWYYQTGGASKRRFSRKHDTILLYAKGDQHFFDGKAIAIPRTEKAMRRARSGKGARIAVTDTTKNPDDVFIISALNAMAEERVGYPTQKPLELLRRLVVALCPPGGWVGDFMCGSGTTLLAAAQAGRNFAGCDISPTAVALAKQRLKAYLG
jgi:DNA modification methylase